MNPFRWFKKEQTMPTDRITQADLDGTSERGRRAFQDRLRVLRSRGIPLPTGAVINDDSEPGDAELRRSDPDAYRQTMADRAEVSKLEADEAEFRASALEDDDSRDRWMWPNGVRPTH